MTLLLRTINSYPKGKLSEELIYLLDKDCDPHKRISVFSELTELEKQNLIFRGTDGKWRGRFNFQQESGQEAGALKGELIEAVTGQFYELEQASTETVELDTSSALNLKQLLGYFKAAVRADARGALGVIPEAHGTKWQLISGGLPQVSGESDTQIIRLTLKLDHLPGTFRQALLRREESDRSITLGWPICTGVDRSAPKVWPVGLFSGHYERTESELLIDFDLQNLFVNPSVGTRKSSSDWMEPQAATRPISNWFSTPAFSDRVHCEIAGSCGGLLYW